MGTSPFHSLFPRPRHVELTGGAARLSPIDHEADPTLPQQGFEIALDGSGVVIRSRDQSGRRYATDVIGQLAATPDTLPAARIRDWPDIDLRGYMLDISRDRVPTMETLARLVGHLSRLRINHLELYVEHTFAYRSHHIVWRHASPVTPVELSRLDKLCASAGIDLVANQNTFAHMGRWLRHDPYRSRAECPEARHPDCLAPTPANADFAVDLVREMASTIESKTVHIGGDEPDELGLGVSRHEVAAHGVHAVYVEHLNRIIEPLIDQGMEVLFWGDVLRDDPDSVKRLPATGAAAVAWNYEASVEFASHARSYVDTGYPLWIAPGTSSWNSLFGRWANASVNLNDAARFAVDVDAEGLLIADWGDNGHLQPLAVSIAPLIFGAGVAWCADSNSDVDVAPLASDFLGDPTGRTGDWLIELGGLAAATGIEVNNGSPVFHALIDDGLTLAGPQFDRSAWQRSVDLVDASLDELDLELAACARLARQGLWRLGGLNGMPVPPPSALALDMDECIGLQRQAWLSSSRPGGLDDSLSRLPLGGC